MQIVSHVERTERTTNQKPSFSKDKHSKFPVGGVANGPGGVHACVFLQRMSAHACRISQGCPPFPQRNISKIATTNQTECKSALWKEQKKKKGLSGTFGKTGIHFSPFTVPGAQKWVTALQLHSNCWNRTLGFIFSRNELQVFPPAGAQLYYSSWKLHHARDEGIQRVSKVE